MTETRRLPDDAIRAIRLDIRSSRKIAADYGISHLAIWRIKRGATYRDVSTMPQPNSYIVGDALAVLKDLPDSFVSGVVTNPPYEDGRRPRSEYIKWQREFLHESLRVVGPRGLVCYQVKWHYANLAEDSWREVLDGFPVRQTIIWEKPAPNGADPTLLPANYEVVVLLAGKNWVVPKGQARKLGRSWMSVWRIAQDSPLGLAERMVLLCGGAVLDPFAGSGTTGLAAKKVGVPYYLVGESLDDRQSFLDSVAG